MNHRGVIFFYLLFFLVIFMTSSASSLTYDPVMHLKFDGNFLDSSGYNNHGACTGTSCPVSISGKIEQAYKFDGSNDYVYVRDSASLDLTNKITVSAWVYLNSNTNEWITVGQKSASTWFVWQMYARSVDAQTPNYPVFRINFDGQGDVDSDEEVQGTSILSTGQWYHLVGVYDGTRMSFYQNGQLGESIVVSKPIPTSNYNVWIGRNDKWSEPLNGIIDDFRIYNRALTEAEVLELYNLEQPIPDPVCGNNIIESGEVCDGTDLNSQTCSTLGYDTGTLSCSSDCLSYNTINCQNICGITVNQCQDYAAQSDCNLDICSLHCEWDGNSCIEKQKKRIYIALDDHTDYFWSADNNIYDAAFVNMLDYYLDDATATEYLPAQFQSKFNADGSYWMYVYEKEKPERFSELISRIKDGHITVPRNPLSVVYGAQPAEAVLRGMYYTGEIEREYNANFPLALHMENQVMPYGIGSLWSGSGVEYSWKGVCGCDHQVSGLGDRDQEIYWWKGKDGSRVLTKWNSLFVSNDQIGGYAEARNPSSIVDYVDTDSTFKSAYPYNVIGAFGKGWDDIETYSSQFVTVAQQKTNAERDVIVSNEIDFFEDFESKYGEGIPDVSVSYGNEWELYAAAMSEQTAKIKRSTEKLRSAEALATLVSLENSIFMDGKENEKKKTWMNIGLFWEHDLGMVSPPTGSSGITKRINWQKDLARQVESYVNNLENEAAASLAEMISPGSNQRFYVFNPLSWNRDDFSDLEYSGDLDIHVIDVTTGQESPSQIVNIDGKQYLRIFAEDIPAVGYKVFEIVPGLGSSFSDAASVSSNIIENEFYRITLDQRGAITSLIDKQRGNKEFVLAINGRTINDLGSCTGGTVSVENQGPVSVTLKATCSFPLQHDTRITLFRDSSRIDIKNDVNQNFDATNSWRYSFNIQNPEVMHEEVGAIIKAKTVSQGGDYANKNARYDWLTLNHFVDMTGNNQGITLSNIDASFFKLGSSTYNFLDTNTPQISLLLGGHVANGGNGFANQVGDTHFLQRFALQTHDSYDQINAMKFSLEHQNPLVSRTIIGGNEKYPNDKYSLLSVSNPNVLLWSIKPSEEGIDQGIIARVWNLADNQNNLNINFPNRAINSAKETTHVETDMRDIAVNNNQIEDSMNPQQLKTYRLFTAGLANCIIDSDCDDGLYCNGAEICQNGNCQSGNPISCFLNNLNQINTCSNDPDNNPFTLDYFEGFISHCDEQTDSCTTGAETLTHTCNKLSCNAECETNNDCIETGCNNLDGCYFGIYRNYDNVINNCMSCVCEANICDDYTEEQDADLDGFSASCGDCDNSNININPNALEVCDGIDNNCDGSIDEVCECIVGQTRQCGAADAGICEFGTETCSSGAWGECIGEVLPQEEIFNDGIDQNCDGLDSTLTITFNKGWNLASLPFDYSFEKMVTEVNPFAIAQEDPFWKLYIRDDPSIFNSLLTFNSLEGFRLNLESEISISPVFEPVNSYSYILTPGINIIGYPHYEGKDITEALFLELSTGNIEQIFTYKNNILVRWVKDNPGASTLQTLEPGYAYYVTVTNPTAFNFQNGVLV
jgi:alpha-mannosidase